MKLMIQIGIVFSVCLLGQIVSSLLPIAVPGSIISMVILFLLLLFKLLKVDHIRQKADFLLKNMAFFFVPAGVGIVADYQSISPYIARLLAVIVISTVLTFAAAAFTVRSVMIVQNRITRVRGGRRG